MGESNIEELKGIEYFVGRFKQNEVSAQQVGVLTEREKRPEISWRTEKNDSTALYYLYSNISRGIG